MSARARWSDRTAGGPLALVIAIIAMGAARLTKGIAGFGASLVALPLLMLWWSPMEAILMVVTVDSIIGIWLAWQARRQMVWWVIVAMFVPALLGQFVGTEVLMWMPEHVMRIALGIVVAAYGLWVLLFAPPDGHGENVGLPHPVRPALAWGAASGLIGGVMAGAVGVGGPPVVAFVRRWFTDSVGRAVLIGFFLPSAMALTVNLALRGAATPEVLGTLPWVLPVGVLSAVLGTWLSPRLGSKVFRRFVGLLLVASSTPLFLG